MDYSSLPNDPDHPAGTSPWSSSPQPNNNRSTFQSSTSADVPSSQLATSSPYTPEPSSGPGEQYSSDQAAGGGRYDRPESSGEGSVPEENGNSPDLSARLQSPQIGEPGFMEQHQYQQQQQHYSQQRADGPQRYQTGARAGQRQSVPQYKLQAKVTALERTGRKDPILRFDVHVGTFPIA